MLRMVPDGAAPANEPTRAPRYSDRVRARTELIRTYAGRMGLTTVAADIQDAINLHQDANGTVGQSALLAGAKAAGMLAQAVQVAHPTPDHWPAIALMKNGQAVLVLSQDHTTLTIWDEARSNKTERVDIAEFAPFYGGVLVRGEAPVQTLVDAHRATRDNAHWFWGSFSNYTRQFGEVALGSFVANLLAVSVALFSLQVYDRVIPHQSTATLWVLAIGAAMALMMEAFLKVARSTLLDGAGRQIETGVQQTLLARLLGMRSDVAGRSPSQLFASMREFGSVREFFTASTVGALADIPFIVLFLLMVWSIAGSVVWVLVAGAVLMVVPGFFLQKKMIRITQDMQGASAKQSRLLNEAVTELDTIKTQRAEDRFRRSWEELTSVQSLKSSEQRRLAAALTFWSQGVQQATYVGAVIAGTYLVFAGEFTVGSIIAVGILTSRTLAPLTQLAGIMARWGNVKAALDALDGIAHLPQDRCEGRKYLRRANLEGRFELREVAFRYDPECPAVLDIPSFVIQPGQTLAILGTNGSGKSTLLKMLSGLYTPTSGSILIDGTDMGQIDIRDLRRSIGYLGQDVRLFHGTLRDNLNLNMLERDDTRLFEALDFAGLGPFVKGHPQGLDLAIRDGGDGLSVGQRQSIGWARLWLQDPDVCLLDEPTAALDQTLEKTLISRLETWLAHRTTVVATHRVPILALADRTSVLANGRLVVDGPRDQVLNHLRSGQGA
ncbi:type I secretion system permease/ATPase [Marivita sp. S2033]|uniref:type I secretion system permease/ATPase n=1 Tax=Marivita sp. S2033 TaxID=3373187 RepID=UPI003981AF6D